MLGAIDGLAVYGKVVGVIDGLAVVGKLVGAMVDGLVVTGGHTRLIDL